MNPGDPATKGDLIEVNNRIDGVNTRIDGVNTRIDGVNTRIDEVSEQVQMLRSEMNHGYADLKTTMRDIQTELLTAFYNYGQTTDLKLKDLETSDSMARQRLSVLESRITDIERRLNMPPQPN